MSEQNALERFAKDYPSGTVLFREGTRGGEMYVIQAGEVEISRALNGERQVLAVLAVGEFFGEMAIVNNRPRTATAEVARDARLLVIDSHTFEAMVRARAEIALRIIRSLADRLERANQQIELLLVRDANHRVVRCLRQMADAVMRVRQGEQEGAVFIATSLAAFARRVALREPEVEEVLVRLAAAGLVEWSRGDTGEGGFVVPEVDRLVDFLEFLELKDRVRGGS